MSLYISEYFCEKYLIVNIAASQCVVVLTPSVGGGWDGDGEMVRWCRCVVADICRVSPLGPGHHGSVSVRPGPSAKQH